VTFKFTPIRSQRTVDTVVERLEERVLDGTFSDGDLLPSEEQLSAQLGVGRRSVREALKVLETKGLVKVRMGVGAVVKRNDLDTFLDALARNVRSYLSINKADAEHVAELRSLLEGAALEQLATAPDGAGVRGRVERLAEAVARQRQAVAANDPSTYQEWHFHFHCEIADALDNPLVSMILKQVLALMRGPMEIAGSRPEVTSQTIEEHERMVEAIRRGATTELRTLLASHLQGFLANIELPDATASDEDEAAW
jgi:GntR family transcriptional repressor for pyruvate dehydrogenase complex